jgi:ketosteroid isomerase-like protein
MAGRRQSEDLNMNTDPMETALAWAHAFARCVRQRDFDAGKSLFAPDAHSFGTRMIEAHGRDMLLAEQWLPTWTRTQGFDYAPGSLRAQISGDGGMALITARWQSLGVDDASRWGQQAPYRRNGRCSLVLARTPDGPWRCVHSHFSMDPEGQRPG